jgi:hypothetical protein
MPVLAMVGVLSFLWGGGDVVFTLTPISDESKRVVTTGLANSFGAFVWSSGVVRTR